MKLSDEKRAKIEAFKDKVKQRASEAIVWSMNHAKELTAVALVVVPASVKISKNISHAHTEYIEQKRRDTDYYDPVLFSHVYTRRRLTPSEKAELARRRANGETITAILYDMDLIAR